MHASLIYRRADLNFSQSQGHKNDLLKAEDIDSCNQTGYLFGLSDCKIKQIKLNGNVKKEWHQSVQR